MCLALDILVVGYDSNRADHDNKLYTVLKNAERRT